MPLPSATVLLVQGQDAALGLIYIQTHESSPSRGVRPCFCDHVDLTSTLGSVRWVSGGKPQRAGLRLSMLGDERSEFSIPRALHCPRAHRSLKGFWCWALLFLLGLICVGQTQCQTYIQMKGEISCLLLSLYRTSLMPESVDVAVRLCECNDALSVLQITPPRASLSHTP